MIMIIIIIKDDDINKKAIENPSIKPMITK